MMQSALAYELQDGRAVDSSIESQDTENGGNEQKSNAIGVHTAASASNATNDSVLATGSCSTSPDPHLQIDTCPSLHQSSILTEPTFLGHSESVLSTGASQVPTTAAQLGASCVLTSLSSATFPAPAPAMSVLGAPGVTFQPLMKGHAKKQSPSERLQRSRERNRMHARKTRQRKKEHVQVLQSRADELKQEQLRLRQLINEKNTASILVGLFSPGSAESTEDPRVEQLLHRPVEDIPDSSKIPELPALILPGQHSCKKNKAPAPTECKGDLPDDGIDYDLLGKDRAQCTPEELDQIRRERNRMHAKRTRDRKRRFMEEMEEIIKKLEEENDVLKGHADNLKIDYEPISASTTPSLSSPSLKPGTPALLELPAMATEKSKSSPEVDQIKSLLAAAGAFDKKTSSPQHSCTGMMTISSVASVVSATHSAAGSVADENMDETLSNGSASPRPNKRLRLEPSRIVSAVPASIASGV